MKKFINKILNFLPLIFVGFLILWFFLYINPLSYSKNTQVVVNNVKNYTKSSSHKEVIVIGDSRASVGISPKVLNSGNSYNLSTPAATPIEGYFTLKHLIENNKKPEILILSFSPDNIVWDEMYPKAIAEGLMAYKEIKELYQDINSQKDIFWDIEKLSFSKINEVNLLKAYLYKLKFPFFFRAEMSNSMFMRTSDNLKFKESIEKDMGCFSYSQRPSNGRNEESKLTNFKANIVIEKYLIKLLNLAEINNIQVIYYNAPFNKTSYENLSLKFKSDYISFFNKIKKLYPKTLFLSQIRYYNNYFFSDNSHLNIKGQLKFSNELNDTLKKIKARTHNLVARPASEH